MNPLEHIGFYHVWMEFEAAEDAIMCRAFPLMLGGVARAWFRSLRPEAIELFKQLADAFVTQFLGAKPVKKPPSHLSSIVHREGKFLKVYVSILMEAMQMA